MDAYRALSLAFTEILGLIANLSPKQGHFESLSTHDSAFLEPAQIHLATAARLLLEMRNSLLNLEISRSTPDLDTLLRWGSMLDCIEPIRVQYQENARQGKDADRAGKRVADCIKAAVLSQQPKGARFYALTNLDDSRRWPSKHNLSISPFESEDGSPPPGNYSIAYFPIRQSTIAFSKWGVCRIERPLHAQLDQSLTDSRINSPPPTAVVDVQRTVPQPGVVETTGQQIRASAPEGGLFYKLTSRTDEGALYFVPARDEEMLRVTDEPPSLPPGRYGVLYYSENFERIPKDTVITVDARKRSPQAAGAEEDVDPKHSAASDRSVLPLRASRKPPLGLTSDQRRVLEFVQRHTKGTVPPTRGQIARNLRLTAHATQRHLDALFSAGHIVLSSKKVKS